MHPSLASMNLSYDVRLDCLHPSINQSRLAESFNAIHDLLQLFMAGRLHGTLAQSACIKVTLLSRFVNKVEGVARWHYYTFAAPCDLAFLGLCC